MPFLDFSGETIVMTHSDAEIDALLDMDLGMGDEDWTPTPHGRFLAQVLAEHNMVEGKSVLELGGGVGNHSIILARQNPSHLVITEVTEGLLATTRENVERNVPGADFVEYRVADWLDLDGQFDVLVSNPPFARSGRQNRRYFIDELILNSHKRLTAGGELVFIQSSMADIHRTRRDLKRNGFDSRIVDQASGAFRDYYFEDKAFMAEIELVPDGYERDEEDNYIETLFVIAATLMPWTPPDFAHIPTELRDS